MFSQVGRSPFIAMGITLLLLLLGFWFKFVLLVLLWLRWYYVGCVGNSLCDGKLTKIPKRDFIFARVKTGQVGT